MKYDYRAMGLCPHKSPSMRREWIEICGGFHRGHVDRSPSMRREWIEIRDVIDKIHMGEKSPSMRREWIEMLHRT